MKYYKIRILVLGIVATMAVGATACGNTSENSKTANVTVEESTQSEPEKTEAYEIQGTLGKEVTLSDLTAPNSEINVIEFTALFDHKNGAEYPYQFLYNVRNDDGSITEWILAVKDPTGDELLTELNEKESKDKIVVKVIAKFDKVEAIEESEDVIRLTAYDFQALDAEILNPESAEAKEITENYYRIGDKVRYSNGVTYTILDAGKYADTDHHTYAYVELDIENQGDEEYTVYNNSAFYGDNYLLDHGYPSAPDANNISSETISGGRKMKERIYGLCDDFDNLTKIEAEFDGITILIKDDQNVVQDNSEYVPDIQNDATVESKESTDNKSDLGYDIIPGETYISESTEGLTMYANMAWGEDDALYVEGFAITDDGQVMEDLCFSEWFYEDEQYLGFYDSESGKYSMVFEDGYIEIMEQFDGEPEYVFSGSFDLME